MNKIFIILLALLLVTNVNAREIAQEEDDQYTKLTDEATKLIEPYLHTLGKDKNSVNKQDIKKAIGFFNEALKIYPEEWKTIWLKGKAYQALNETQQAYESFKIAYQLNTDNPDVAKEYILASINLNKITEALPVTRLALKKFPTRYDLRLKLALILVLENKLNESFNAAYTVLEKYPENQVIVNLIMLIKEIKAGRIKRPKDIDALTRIITENEKRQE